MKNNIKKFCFIVIINNLNNLNNINNNKNRKINKIKTKFIKEKI